jgi:hypothetical protein
VNQGNVDKLLTDTSSGISVRLGNTKLIIIWASVVVISSLGEGIVLLVGERYGTSANMVASTMSMLIGLISTPLLVGFAYVLWEDKKRKLTAADGALRGAFASLTISSTHAIMSTLLVFFGHNSASTIRTIVNIIASQLFTTLVQDCVLGCVAGIIAVRVREIDQEKDANIENADSRDVGEKHGRYNPGSEVLGLNKTEWKIIFALTPYFFILMGLGIMISILVSRGYGAILVFPWGYIFWVPYAEALVTSWLLRKLYKNNLSEFAIFIASLVFLFSSTSALLYVLSQAEAMSEMGLLMLIPFPLVSGVHIFVLVVVLLLGKMVKSLIGRDDQII